MVTFCVSEQDAKVMTCPLSIGVQPCYHPTDGQGIRDGGPWPCVGSRCMAWRWIETNIRNQEGPDAHLVPSGDTHGYCGLAGIPGSMRR